MKKDKKKILVVLFIIIIPAFWIIFNNDVKHELSDMFTIKNISEVSTVTIKNNTKSITIRKIENTNNWFVNDKYEANKKSIKKLIQALTEVQISNPVLKKNIDSVKVFINNSAKKIIVLNKKNDTLKTIYISEYNTKKEGTYALSDNYDLPYIISIPGLEKDLNQRYNLNPLYWINPEIFTYQPHEIKTIEIKFSNKEKVSYRIEIEKDTPKIFSYNEQKYQNDININKVGSYLSYFMNVKFSDFNTLIDEKRDSLKNSKADYSIFIKDIYNITKEVDFYKIKVSETNEEFDLNKLYAIINKEDIVIVKYFDIDLILKDISYFKN